METHADNQAMTEVALGLAMAFFALMILSMVSMSIQRSPEASKIVRSAQVKAQTPDAGGENTTEINNQDVIIVFYQGRYLDANLEPINLDTLPSAQRYVLAFAPDLSFETVLSARGKISASNLIITELDPAWLQRLAQ